MWTGAEIKRRRNAKGWSQQQLADALGASRRAVISWEAETSVPQGRFIAQMERVFDEDGSASGQTGLALADADFAATINHLIDLHNEALRGRVHRVISTDDTPPPSTLAEGHAVVEGPMVESVEHVDVTESDQSGVAQRD